jgi:hypothetical protein
METLHERPAASVLAATDILRESLEETWLERYTSNMALLEADLKPFQDVVDVFQGRQAGPRAARRLFQRAVEASNSSIVVGLQDAVEQTPAWEDFIADLEQYAWESGFPEWSIWSSDPLIFSSIQNMSGFDPFLLLSSVSTIPQVVVVDTGLWIFIVRSDRSFWGERAGSAVGRIKPIISGVPLKLVDPDLRGLPFVDEGIRADPHCRPSEFAEECYALPSLLQDSLHVELAREAMRRGTEDIRAVWEELLLEELGW